MTYFRRSTTIADRQHEAITRAYRAAGITPPNARADALDAINTEPGAVAVANELAREAHTADDAQRFMENALERLARAQAGDALRTALAQVEPQVRRETMPTTLARATADLGPAFATTVKELTAAAAKLDHDKPLNLDNAVRDDSTKALKAAQAALAALGPYASMFTLRPSQHLPVNLTAVLPLLALPECVIELRAPSMANFGPVINAADCAGSYTVRDLARAMERDVDSALVAVARGDFEGVTFQLAANALEVDQRSRTANRAHARRTASTEAVNRQRAVTHEHRAQHDHPESPSTGDRRHAGAVRALRRRHRLQPAAQ